KAEVGGAGRYVQAITLFELQRVAIDVVPGGDAAIDCHRRFDRLGGFEKVVGLQLQEFGRVAERKTEDVFDVGKGGGEEGGARGGVGVELADDGAGVAGEVVAEEMDRGAGTAAQAGGKSMADV